MAARAGSGGAGSSGERIRVTRSGSGGPLFLGYPVLAVVFFLLAAIGGLALVVSIVLSDRRSAKLARLSQQRRDSAVHT